MGLRGSWSKYIFALSAVVFCASCSTNINPKQKVFSAPNSQSQTGWLVSGPAESDVSAFLTRHPQAKVRQIHSRHGVFEFYHVDLTELERAFPSAIISANQFIRWQSEQNNSDLNRFLLHCRTRRPDSSLIEIVQPASAIQGAFQIQLGQSLELESMASFSLLWTGYAPAGSKMNGISGIGQKFSFKPDMVGIHQVLLVNKDENENCSGQILNFGVTANSLYRRSSPDLQLESEIEISQFQHLKELRAMEAWEWSQGQGITIAIIDSGVNYNHPLLSPNIRYNDDEIADNGFDDDNNGFVDDLIGYDFVNQDSYPWDDNGHGTHVSGLAAARVFGVAPRAKILPVKGLGSLGGDLGSVVGAIYYAADNGAQIINLSWGRHGPEDPLLAQAIDYAAQKNALVVTAAGNGSEEFSLGVDIDQSPLYPASLANNNLLSVTASDRHNAIALYANFGQQSVDLVAPGGFSGDEIMSTYLTNPDGLLFSGLHGTSMAAPQVSGIAALVWAQKPQRKFLEVKNLILRNGHVMSELAGLVNSSSQADALQPVKQSVRKKAQCPRQKTSPAQRPDIIRLAP